MYIESVGKENDYFLSRKKLIEGLARRIESLSKKLNITPEKLNELIEKNVVSKKRRSVIDLLFLFLLYIIFILFSNVSIYVLNSSNSINLFFNKNSFVFIVIVVHFFL